MARRQNVRDRIGSLRKEKAEQETGDHAEIFSGSKAPDRG